MAKVTVELSDQMDSTLNAIARRRGLPKTQALRRAVALLKYLDDADARGDKVVIKAADGEELHVVFDP